MLLFLLCPNVLSCFIHPLCYTSLFLSLHTVLLPRNVNSPSMGLSRWQGQYNTVGAGEPCFIPVEKTGISIRTCPLLRTWIMLSVHRHCRSWNDKANELRAGRWVRDLLSLNQLTSRPLLCVLLGITVHWLHTAWDLNSSAMHKASCAPNKPAHCDWMKI